MIPVVSHDIKTRRWPYVTICLIGLNVIAFVFETTLGARFVPFLQSWGIVPARLQAEIAVHGLLALGTSLYLHVGFLQLLGNMWFLYVFGDAVEDAFGHWWYLGIYLASGLMGAMLLVAATHGSSLPVIGAGGAVSGVVAASLMLWPRARLRTPGIFLLMYILGLLYAGLVAIGLPGWTLGGPVLFVVGTLATVLLTRKGGNFLVGLLGMVELPAWAAAGLFVSFLLFSGLFVVVNPAFAGAAGYWADVGGFAAGALLAWAFPKHVRLLAERPKLG